MMHSTDGLYQELRVQLVEIDKQIDAVKKDIEFHIAGIKVPHEYTVHNWMRADGVLQLQPLTIARANVLAAMASLKQAQVAERVARRKGEW